jgi:hypothetical protein
MPLVNVLINSTTAGVGSGKVIRGNAPAPIFLDYLVVGGGQYSDNIVAGGGGGVESGSIRFLPRFTLDITVGAGGTGSTLIDAQPSIIETSIPASEFFVYAGPGGGFGTSGEPQNNPKGTNSPNYSQGGAGGSGQDGQAPPTSNQGGAGGNGSAWAFDNTGSLLYGGGGGGYGAAVIASQAISGIGGAGGGGRGEGFTLDATDGLNGFGGGAGGVRFRTNRNGGSGIVKLRYLSGSVSGAIGGQTSVSGGYVYHTFTGSGQFVYQP